MYCKNKNTCLWLKISLKLLITKAVIDKVPREKDQREFNKDN